MHVALHAAAVFVSAAIAAGSAALIARTLADNSDAIIRALRRP